MWSRDSKVVAIRRISNRKKNERRKKIDEFLRQTIDGQTKLGCKKDYWKTQHFKI